MKKSNLLLISLLTFGYSSLTRGQSKAENPDLFTQPGVIIMIILLIIPIMIFVFILVLKLTKVTDKMVLDQEQDEEERFAKYLANLEGDEIQTVLESRKKAIDYKLSNSELSGYENPIDEKGLITNVDEEAHIGFVAAKKKHLNDLISTQTFQN